MSEQNNQSKQNIASDESYSFYWNYGEQLAHDRCEKAKKGKRGIVIYVSILAAVFLVSFAMLAAAIALFAQTPSAPPVTEDTQYQQVQQSQQQQQQQQQQQPQPTPTTNTAAVAAKVNPSVVLIQVATASSSGSGTGFFLTSNGYIITNHHVIEGATQIRVTLYDDRALDATLIGYRAEDDIAVIKIEGEGYSPVAIGDSNALLVGDVAIAIGNPGGVDGGWSTTQGIISALNRIISVEEPAYFSEMKMIQTDAQVNPGNSGGPLCNASGEVIGIITRKISDFEGIGYAIPITEAMLTINAIMNDELDGFVSAVSKSRPKIGITGSEITKGEKFTLGGVEYAAPVPGFFVLEISPNTGAYGIVEVGDILCSVNGVTVTDLESFKNELYKCYVGQKVIFDIYRRGQKITVEITLGVSQ